MKKTTYALLDSFEMGGRWRLPGRPDKVVPGTLTGVFFFHRGDESEIELSRMPEKKMRPRKRK